MVTKGRKKKYFSFMSKNKGQKILAIDPGTKYMGVAFFDGKKLVYHGVVTIPNLKSPREKLQEGRRTILRLIHDFKPEILVVEKTFFANNKNSVLLNTFTREIQNIGKKQGLQVSSFAANTVRKYVCGNGFASKEETAKVLITKYPELKPHLNSNRRWKEKFYRNMFDAVAVGLMKYQYDCERLYLVER
jgi:crossover junction endodeoxyribonuclease RuvC